jgi:hypothetical protein
MRPRTLALALAVLGAVLAGCGRQAELERPSPLIGKPKSPSAERVARDEAAARARRDAAGKADPIAPQSVDEVREQGRVAQRRQRDAASAQATPPPSSAQPAATPE